MVQRHNTESQLHQLFDHLAATLDPMRQAEIEQLHRDALRWEPVRRLPLVLSYPFPTDAPFQPYPHGQIFDGPEKMLYNEFVYAFSTSIACRDRLGDDLAVTVRPNFGPVIMASLFAGRVEQIGDNPPWCRPFETPDQFRAAMDLDPFDFSRGWCPRVVEHYQFYRQQLVGYPELAKLVQVVLPDLQGPLVTCDLLRGSDLYADFLESPDLVSKSLDVLARAQIALARHFLPYTSDSTDGFSHQQARVICGNISVRDDSAVMISAKMYREQVARYDEMVLGELGGGGVHSCGKIEHNIDEFFSLPSLRFLDLGQSDLNDIDTIYAKARPRKIALTRVQVPREELISGRVMSRFPTGISLAYKAQSFADAQEVMAAYRNATE
jgi:hypothetical protein